MKKILINATQPEELRVAIVDGQKLIDLDIEAPARAQRKSNIYRGRITRIEPSLEAAFIDYGSERHGFLPMKGVARADYVKDPGEGKVQIKDVLKEGQEVTVQVEKEERGTKGAALTTQVSLAGRYLVLMPNNPRAGGISRRINGQEREELRAAMSELKIPAGMGVIARTAGIGRPAEELQWDLDYLVALWKAIQKTGESRKSPFLIYQESNVIIRALRDYLRTDISEVIIDDLEIHQQARDFMEQVMPQSLSKLKRYDDTMPLFSRYQMESQIETAFRRSVTLPSGGSLVIDHTEALLSIDINSARAIGGADIEETALNTNLEAADEIARQLRLRDLGGLVVIDFIDMGPSRNQRQVENKMREVVKADRARVQVGRISRFGLLELSRQRLRPPLGDYSHITCPRCGGEGSIRNVESLALSVLRLMEEEAMKEKTGHILARLPVPVATFLLNEKRPAIAELESGFSVNITIVPSPELETPDYELKRIREDEVAESEVRHNSYQLPQAEEQDKTAYPAERSNSAVPQPALRHLPARGPAPAQASADAPADGKDRGVHRLVGALRTFFAPPKEQPSSDDNQPSQRPAQETKSGRTHDNRGGQQKSRSADSSDVQKRQGNNKSAANGSGKKAQPQQANGSSNKSSTQSADKDSAANKNAAEGEKGKSGQSSQGQASQQNKRGGRRSRGRRGGRNRPKAGNGNNAATETGDTKGSDKQQATKSGNNAGSRNAEAKGGENRTSAKSNVTGGNGGQAKNTRKTESRETEAPASKGGENRQSGPPKSDGGNDSRSAEKAQGRTSEAAGSKRDETRQTTGSKPSGGNGEQPARDGKTGNQASETAATPGAESKPETAPTTTSRDNNLTRGRAPNAPFPFSGCLGAVPRPESQQRE
jgi:ribonuclease E